MKPGLANIITVFCVYRYKPHETAMVVAVRVFLGSLFASSFSTIIFSAAGAFLCLAGMIPLSRILPKMPMWLCSVIGAVLHNIGQVAAAVAVTGSLSIMGYLPVLLAFGCAAGAFTGVCAQLVSGRMKK
jgi:heptaprenyl diphosphate synthase